LHVELLELTLELGRALVAADDDQALVAGDGREELADGGPQARLQVKDGPEELDRRAPRVSL
jgi:hypothetical protein